MSRLNLLAAFVYATGTLLLLYWSVSGFFFGAPRENWPLMIVLPAAWIISFWPIYGSMLVAYKVWTIQDTLQRVGDTIEAAGSADKKDLKELEDLGTRLAAGESGIPEFIVRPMIRRLIARVNRDSPAAA
jgi:hypothetical protein